MTTYFVSQYLNVIDLEHSSLLFSGATGLMDEVSQTLGDKLKAPQVFDGHGVSEVEIDYLKKRGHITLLSREEEVNVFKDVVRQLEESRQHSARQRGYIMVLLSYNCNLDCHYCYQRQIRRRERILNQQQVMSPAFVEKLFTQHLKALFPGVPYDEVDIVLYGGEPFLPQHRPAIVRLLELVQQTPVAGIRTITNGTQLDTMLDCFGPLPGQVNQVQISLDGDQESHDTSRIPASKIPTFQKILRNVHRMVDKKVRVSLRINVTPESIRKLDGLMELLEKEELLEHPLLDPYVHPIHIHYDHPDEDGMLSVPEAMNYIRNSTLPERIKNALPDRVELFNHLTSLQQGTLGLQRSSFCMISTENAVIVDPYGDIYKCYDEAGREEFKVGEIRDGEVRWFESVLNTYHSRNVSTIPQCSTCSVALACGGECGAFAKAKYHDYFTPYCNGTKPMLLEALKRLYQKKKSQAARNNLA